MVMFYTHGAALSDRSDRQFPDCYVKADLADKPAVTHLLMLVGILAGTHATVAMIRLSSKRVLGGISLDARYRAKVWALSDCSTIPWPGTSRRVPATRRSVS